MTQMILNTHPVQAYVQEKQRIYQHIQDGISTVLFALIEDLQPLFADNGYSDLERCEVLNDGLTIAVGNNDSILPSTCENAIRHKVWDYFSSIDIKALTVEGIYSESETLGFHSCKIAFKQPSLFRKWEQAFDVSIDSRIECMLRGVVALGPTLLRPAPETVSISLPLLDWLDVHHMREYQALFDTEWKALRTLATLNMS